MRYLIRQIHITRHHNRNRIWITHPTFKNEITHLQKLPHPHPHSHPPPIPSLYGRRSIRPARLPHHPPAPTLPSLALTSYVLARSRRLFYSLINPLGPTVHAPSPASRIPAAPRTSPSPSLCPSQSLGAAPLSPPLVIACMPFIRCPGHSFFALFFRSESVVAG